MSLKNAELPIGLFDSGLGGLTVVRAMQHALPRESLLYFGDTARLPYGSKSAETVTRYSLQIGEYLCERGIKYLVVACNTASAHALDALKVAMPVPVVGVVEPGAKRATELTKSGHIGVLGTLGTIRSGAYQRAIAHHAPKVKTYAQACPLWVPLVEEGWLNQPATVLIVDHYLNELKAQSNDIDTIVLGCTHYPLLSQVIEARAKALLGHTIQIVDSGACVAERVNADLQSRGLLSTHAQASETYLTTDDARFHELAERFLGRDIERVERVTLE